MNKLREPLAQLLLICMVGYTPVSEAYDLSTHEAINVGGVVNSRLDTRLRSELGFLNGVQETIHGKRVINWVRQGGVLEDTPFRFLHHFHHPLRSPWRNAGLNDVFTGNSAILWSQDSSQGFSWINARQAYYIALTSPDKGQREQAFANTFRALGQVMHLIADSSVPAHVRNDQHAGGDPFEEWVELQARPRPGEPVEGAHERFIATFALSIIFPDDSFILTLPILGQDATDAPIPIARLWDTDQYDGTNPAITLSPRVGITEYANATFFSEDTVFANEKDKSHKHFFPFPSSADVELWVDPANKRKYWRKKDATPGEPQHLAEHLATASKRTDWEQSSGIDLPKRGRLDEKVHENYARLLIPRALGYSATLLDYFFRGRLEASFAEGPNGGRERILKTKNATGEPIGPGTLQLLYEDSGGTRRLLQEQSVPDLGSTPDLPPIQFEIPAEAPRQYVVVYRGRLGLEADAIAARVLEGVPIVAVQELAALTGAENEKVNPFLGGSGGQELRKDPNHQRAAGYFWAGGTVGVGSKIREVRLEEGIEGGAFLGHFLPKAVLRLNGKEVGTHWRAEDNPGLIPERWEVVLAPIPGQTSDIGVVPPSAIWVNDFRTPLLWVNSVTSATGQFTFLQGDGVPVWITTKVQFTIFHFGDGVRGSDPKSGTPLTPGRTGVSFRPVGEVAGGPVPRAELAFLPESCRTNGPLYRFAFAFAFRPPNFLLFSSACGVVLPAGWAKHLLWLQERVLTLGAQPDPAPPPLLTMATFRREFLDADLERFLSVGIVPLEYDIQTQ